jgi:hypothetical protein
MHVHLNENKIESKTGAGEERNIVQDRRLVMLYQTSESK